MRLLLLALFVSCATPAKPIAPMLPDGTVYCFTMTAKLDSGHETHGVACLDSPGRCQHARGLAIKNSTLAGLTGVSECVEAEIR